MPMRHLCNQIGGKSVDDRTPAPLRRARAMRPDKFGGRCLGAAGVRGPTGSSLQRSSSTAFTFGEHVVLSSSTMHSTPTRAHIRVADIALQYGARNGPHRAPVGLIR